METMIKFDRVEVELDAVTDLFVAGLDGRLYLHEWVNDPDTIWDHYVLEVDLGEY